MAEQQDDERITKRVVYEHATSSRGSTGIIIAIIVIALALLAYIFVQMR